jgi:hypothetical protein
LPLYLAKEKGLPSIVVSLNLYIVGEADVTNISDRSNASVFMIKN